jgi:hypothetical protein
MQIKDGDKFRGQHGEIYEIRGGSFQCYDSTYYPAAEIDSEGRNIEVANWPEGFFLYECQRISQSA